MGHIAVIVGDVYSVRASATELSRRLAVAGHEVLLIVPSGRAAVSGAAGVEVVEHDPTTAPGLGGVALIESIVGVVPRRRRAAEALADPALSGLLKHHGIDLVLVDAELSATIIEVLGSGHRAALLSTFQGIDRDLSRPPAHVGAVPGAGLGGSRLGIAAHWAKFLAKTEVKWARAWVLGRGDSARGRLRRRARQLGLPAGTVDPRQWVRPVGFPGLDVIEFNLAELELPPATSSRRQLVGPMLGVAAAPDQRAADRLARIELARASGERVVYCSFGSFASSYGTALLQRVADAVAQLDGVRLVLGLGGSGGIVERLQLSDDVIVFDWAPQRKVLELADAAVIHGGHATLYECISAAVPVVVLPMTMDQPGYAARVAFHGIGAVGPDDPAAESVEEMAARVSQVLASTEMRRRVAAMSTATDAAVHDRLAEVAVASLLEC
ncbi:MAG: glycosyltransferase [Ilumatobacter sp.]